MSIINKLKINGKEYDLAAGGGGMVTQKIIGGIPFDGVNLTGDYPKLPVENALYYIVHVYHVTGGYDAVSGLYSPSFTWIVTPHETMATHQTLTSGDMVGMLITQNTSGDGQMTFMGLILDMDSPIDCKVDVIGVYA